MPGAQYGADVKVRGIIGAKRRLGARGSQAEAEGAQVKAQQLRQVLGFKPHLSHSLSSGANGSEVEATPSPTNSWLRVTCGWGQGESGQMVPGASRGLCPPSGIPPAWLGSPSGKDARALPSSPCTSWRMSQLCVCLHPSSPDPASRSTYPHTLTQC